MPERALHLSWLAQQLRTLAAPAALLLVLGADISLAAEEKEPGTLELAAEAIDEQLQSGLTQLRERFSDANDRPYPLERRTPAPSPTVDYQAQVAPILNDKCLACHACYDAPCQLKMESGAGLERGGSRLPVYNGARLRDSAPTRLGIDAHSVAAWRERGFYSVLGGVADTSDEAHPALFQQMLDLGQSNPVPSDQPVPDRIGLGLDREEVCPTPGNFKAYAQDNPFGGMPLALAGLSGEEYDTLTTWMNEGAVVNSSSSPLTHEEQQLVAAWESWLNQPTAKQQLLTRYLYEHLFLAHLYLEPASSGKAPRFFRLQRSYTDAKDNVLPVATTRPNDPPPEDFSYRVVAVDETIVHKTHITYDFSAERLTELQRLFNAQPWQVDVLPGYSAEERSNPFTTFAAIPASLRYRFLLQDAGFFVRNFIRGPVCRGQIATDVIRDHFWVMFEDPAAEHYSNDSTYRASTSPLLGLPGQKTSLLDLGPQWLTYSGDRNDYLYLREAAYREAFPDGPLIEHIWDGDGTNANAYLTVFRHHNSASVVRGWQGALPLTAWVLDYPLLERTYYELVVGFNVFGSVAHQAQTRLYFDLIRNEGETNFLRFLPAADREAIYADWYRLSGQLKTLVSYHPLDKKTPTGVTGLGEPAMAGLLEKLQQRQPELTAADDYLNRRIEAPPASVPIRELASWRALRRFSARSAAELEAIRYLPEVTFIQIKHGKNDYRAFTLLRNRRHSNVAFLMGESLRYEEDKDTVTVQPQLIGSYPNLMFHVDAAEVNEFARALLLVDSKDAMNSVVERWGLRRMDPGIWPVFHRFTDILRQEQPLEAGVYDLNRYGRW